MKSMRITLVVATCLSLALLCTSTERKRNENAVQSRDFRTFLGSFVGRQGFFENPLMLALSMFLITLPMLPFIVLGPIALAGVKPAFNAINNAVNNALEPFTNNGISGLLGGNPAGGGPGPGPGPGGPGGSGGAGGNTLFFQKRSVGDDASPAGTRSWWGLMKTVKEGLYTYDITERECQLRIVCEINRRTFSRSLGSFADKLIDIFGLDGRLERTRFKSSTKSVLRTFLKAIRHGMTQKDCNTLYNQCTEIKKSSSNNAPPSSASYYPQPDLLVVKQQPA